jgi:hypothetical protein
MTFPNRETLIDSLEKTEYDILIIGGKKLI